MPKVSNSRNAKFWICQLNIVFFLITSNRVRWRYKAGGGEGMDTLKTNTFTVMVSTESVSIKYAGCISWKNMPGAQACCCKLTSARQLNFKGVLQVRQYHCHMALTDFRGISVVMESKVTSTPDYLGIGYCSLTNSLCGEGSANPRVGKLRGLEGHLARFGKLLRAGSAVFGSPLC